MKESGNFDNTEKFLKGENFKDINAILNEYGRLGVNALQNSTPKDSGKTASSWSYSVSQNGSKYEIVWFNDNVVDYVNIALLIQYDHATGTGGYVSGTDYINPSMKPITEGLASEIERMVKNG